MPITYTLHATQRMGESGVSADEIVEVLATGSLSQGRYNRLIRRKVLMAGYTREGRDYPHKEVRVVYVQEDNVTYVITVWARYGRWEARN